MIEKFKYWLAEINYNAMQDKVIRKGRNATDAERAQLARLRRYLEGKDPFDKR